VLARIRAGLEIIAGGVLRAEAKALIAFIGTQATVSFWKIKFPRL